MRAACTLLLLLAHGAPAAEPAQLEPLWTLQGHVSLVECVAWSPDGKTLVSGGGYTDGALRFWDAENGDPLRTIQGTRERVACVAFSPKGDILASGSSDMTVTLWDPRTGEKMRTLAGLKGGLNAMAFSPDGSRLAAASHGDAAVGLWDTKSWSLIQTMAVRWGAHSVSFSADGQVVGGGGRFGQVIMWNGRSGGVFRSFSSYRKPTMGTGKVTVLFSPDGKLLATASATGDGQVWIVETATLIATLTGHTGRVSTLAFSPDGATLATGSADKTVRLWDLADLRVKNKQAVGRRQ